MPNMRNKRGRDRGYYSGGSHNEHDDRTQVSPHDAGTRRVSFKSGGGGGGGGRRKQNRQRGWDNKIRAHLHDDDIEMITVRGGSNQYQTKKMRGSSFYRDLARRSLNESPSHWYKVTIRYGHKYEKDFLLKILANYIKPVPLVPYAYKVTKDESSFVIGERSTAEELMNADRKINTADGWKLSINVRPVTPYIEIDDKLTALLKKAMSLRYNAYNKSLSLANFSDDACLVSENTFIPLNRPNIMIAVITIIGESIPDLTALDLSNNKLNSIDHLKMLLDKAPRITTLLLSNNKLRDVKLLDSLKGLPLEEINLDGNSLCDKFTDRETYIRAVRQRFPKVIKLDGVELPPPILFDVEDEGHLESSKESFMADSAGAAVVRQFLQQYYQIYDSTSGDGPGSPGRAALLQAYHQQATFSIDAYSPPSESNPNLATYIHESRNLLRITNKDHRVRLLRRGQQSVIETLTALPKTIHDPSSFTVDLVVFTPQLIEVCVCGLFKETTISKKTLTRFFSRAFIIVPVGPGFCIVNEQLTVLPATSQQAKKAFKCTEVVSEAVVAPAATTPAIVPAVVPAAVPAAAAPAVSSAGAPAVLDLAAKQQMVMELAAKTNMNLVWSEKCLMETNWNFEQALFAFSKLQEMGTIPPQAFIK